MSYSFKNDTLLNRKGVSLPLWLTIFCACLFQLSNSQAETLQTTIHADTIITNASKINWNDVQVLSASDGNLLAKMKNGSSVWVSREAYTEYARKKDQLLRERIFEKMEIDPEYPGGEKAWLKYLMRNVLYPQEALNKRVAGRVEVRFIVDENGKVKDVKPLTNFGSGLEKEAVRVVKASGRWNPGIQNFHLVTGYKTMSVVFTVK